MLNRVVLVGRLTKDPDLRHTQSGVAVANFTVAVNRPFSNKNNEQEADFINCVVWRAKAENLAKFMSKGSMIGVDGRLQTRSFDNNEGRKVFVTEVLADSVQFLEPKNKNNNGGNQQSNQQSNQGEYQQNMDPFDQPGEPIDISDDDLPF